MHDTTGWVSRAGREGITNQSSISSGCPGISPIINGRND